MKGRIVITNAIAHAAGTDAGNASMRRAGRKAWSVNDFNESCRAYDRMIPPPAAEREAEVATANGHRKGRT